MKTKLFVGQWSLISLALVWLAGCAGETARPAADKKAVPKEAAAPAPVARSAPSEMLKQAAAKPSVPFEGEDWQPMFNGQTLAGWRETAFANHGDVECQAGLLVMNLGDPFTGVNWTNDFPKSNYEIALDALRVTGSDFFCGLTVPVGDAFCSLIVGGWGGSLVGISSLDGMDASENETTKFINFETGRWYRVRLRVTAAKIEAWIDQEKVADVLIAGKKISVRAGDIEMSQPIGIAAWQTTAALRNLKLRRL